jgi:hypothetical protein
MTKTAFILSMPFASIPEVRAAAQLLGMAISPGVISTTRSIAKKKASAGKA